MKNRRREGRKENLALSEANLTPGEREAMRTQKGEDREKKQEK